MMTEPKQSDNLMDLFSASQSKPSESIKSFSDALINKFIGKICTLYLGDQNESIEFEDHSIPQNCIIYGKIIDVLDRFIVLDCYYTDKIGDMKVSHNIYINTFQIRVMSELSSDSPLDDIFLSPPSAAKVKKALLAKINQK